MNTSLTSSIVLVAAASFPGIAVAGEVFDSPGPGYRQQLERFSTPLDCSLSSDIRIAPIVVLSQPFLNAEPAFSVPIRLFGAPATSATLKKP